MWNYSWPIIMVIMSNTFYHICSRSTPKDINPFIALTITYLVAAVTTIILFFTTSSNVSLITEIKKANWTSLFLGIAVIGLEFGYLQVYRAGWNVSVGSLVSNIGLAIALVFVGALLYKEVIHLNHIIGIALCIIGIVILNR